LRGFGEKGGEMRKTVLCVPLAISQIGGGYDAKNDSFEGVPFMFMLRDILQFDSSLQEETV